MLDLPPASPRPAEPPGASASSARGPIAARHPSMEGNALIMAALLLAASGVAVVEGHRAVTRRATAELVSTTQEMREVSDAIYTYAAMTGNLPCPAAPDATGDMAGVSAPNGTPGALTGCAVLDGIIPWVTLGLPETVTFDRWGRRLSYRLDEALAVTGSLPSAPTPARAGLSICTIPRGSCANPARDRRDIARAVPFLLLSHGVTGAGAWRANGTRVPFANPADETAAVSEMEVANASGTGDGAGLVFYHLSESRGAGRTGRNQFYDDIVTLPVNPKTGTVLSVRDLRRAAGARDPDPTPPTATDTATSAPAG